MSQINKYKLLFESNETSIALYENIDNLSEVLDLTEIEDNFCLINAKAIFDINQVLCAINKSINTKNNNKMITKRLNTEILFSLLPSKNITQSLNEFGVKSSDNCLPIIALIIHQNDNSKTQIFNKIKGKVLPIEELKNFRDESLIDQIYNLKNCSEERHKWDLIISRIATKDFI